MAVWGKMIGTAAGFAAGHVLGAFLGGIAGHAFDQWRGEIKARRAFGKTPDLKLDDILETKRVAFATAVVVLSAKLAKIDGRVHPDEIRAFKRIFDVSDDDVGDVAAIYNEAKKSPEGYQPFARQVAAVFGHERAVLEELLSGLFEVALADGAINAQEMAFLKEVAAIFGFGPFQFEAIRARYMASWQPRQAPVPADDYTVLGLKRGASDDAIKQAWRGLVREHHPDRLTAQGLPQEFVDKATQRLAAINAAYDRIAKERNLR